MKIKKHVGFLSFGLLAGMLLPNPVDKNSFDLSTIYLNNKNNSNSIEKVEDNYIESVSDIAFSSDREVKKDYVYLSDIPYVKNQTSVGWGSLTLDKNLETKYNNGLISLIVNGKQELFLKGISAHATSTVVYDISEYDYDYFSTYYGVDANRGNNGNGVKFSIYTSVDGENWELQTSSKPPVKKGTSEAEFIKLDIRGKNFIKLYAHNNGNDSSDHAVYANAKLYKEGYVEDNSNVDWIKPVSEYDNLIKTFDLSELTQEQELIIYQRKFVNNLGYDVLQAMVKMNDDYNNVISWLMKDLNNLKLYINGGAPIGSYYSSIQVLNRLYKAHGEDFEIETISKYGNVKGEVYKKMAIALSLTHANPPGLWMGGVGNTSDALTRYEIYKKLYDENAFVVNSSIDITKWFEKYQVEEMRWVMNNNIDDGEIIWLHDYTQNQINKNPNNAWALLTPHPYMAYVTPNYNNPIFHDPANYEYFDNLFDGIFSKYGVPYSTSSQKQYKVWMNLRNKWGTGAVCGGISKTGSNIRGSHGIASAVIGQPGHAALLYYSETNDGKGYWGIDNDVSGWTQSEKSERFFMGWGNNGSYKSYYNVPYIIMGQEALNRYESFEKSNEYVLLAETFKDDLSKKEEAYFKSIENLKFNLDAWYGLIQTYKSDSTKTEQDFYDLAVKLSESMYEFPLPYSDLMRQIQGKLTSNEFKFKYAMLLKNTLTKGKNYNGNGVLQPNVTRLMANHLLGINDTSIASFSFDGAKAGKIVLASRFNGSGIRWDYSIDGKKTWKEVSFTGEEPHELQLSQEEIDSITSENDIYVHIVGVNYNEENLYKIDIKDSAGLPSNLYANDLENRIIAAVPAMQWKYEETDEWKKYSEEEPDLTGDKTVIVRMGSTGVSLAGPSNTFNFTQDNVQNARKYISVNHLSISSVSSQATGGGQNGHAINAIDGNIYTRWHSAWDGSDRTKTFVIQLDSVRNLTALEYVPAAGGNGKIESAQILISEDGENWKEVVSGTDWKYANTNDVSIKSVDFEPTRAKFIKIVGKKTQSASSKSFMTASMFNLYENTEIELVAGYSFDGNKAGKIVLETEYKSLEWEYSLDNGESWRAGSGDEHQLTLEEMNQINETDKIKVRFAGDLKQYVINIKKSEAPVITPYVNDLENRLIGLKDVSTLEWQIEGTTTWTSYAEEEPIVKGNKKLFVRTKATGILTASDSVEFQFAEDTDTAKAKYIPVKHLQVHDYSTQSIDSSRPFYAPNAIDANPETLWHTDFRYSIAGTRAHITIKLDEAKYISALEFLQKKYKVNDPDYIKNIYVYVSSDGETWTEAGKMLNCPQDLTLKRLDFEESVLGEYVKIELEGYSLFASLAMINLFENTNVANVASFSFDGENSGKIILTDEYKNSNWEYSLDAGKTWNKVEESSYQLTDEEIQKVNANDKIKIRINNEEYIVNIRSQVSPTINAYLNDLENRLIGITNIENLEWKIESNSRTDKDWTSYAEEEPIVEGNAKLLIRQKAKENIAASDVVEFEFTADNQPDTRKYIPVNRLSLGGFSAEDLQYDGAAKNALDANYNTRWLNSSAGTDTEKYIIIKFDQATYISAMDYVPHTENGKILSGKILGSLDGENFTEITTISGWANDQTTKTVNFDEPVKARYIKIIGEETSYTSDKRHVGARMFNFYEDITKKDGVAPTVELEYSITQTTNQDVTVTLVNESTPIKVLNNNGSKSYTFTENGEFTFEFEDAEGNKGTAIAKVDWIIKTLPTPTINFDIKEPTNKDVTATVTFDREGTVVLNNNGSTSYTFTENGEFTFDFKGPYGNEGSVTVKVDWIIKTLPNAKFEFSTQDLTNEDVTATISFDREGTVILNNNGSSTYTFTENGEFTFEFKGPYGNEGVATAKVDWIDKTAPTATIKYDVLEATNGNVNVTLVDESEDITIINNEGKRTYTFTENGEFTFEFIDKVGNKGTATAKVDWIDRTAPKGSISYNIIKPTSQGVVASINFDKENVKITNNDGKNTHTFTENGEFTFEFIDAAGNKGTTTAKVTWIDRTLPVATITYSSTDLTNKDVVATITFDKENVVVEGGATHTFTENGEYEFKFVGPAGNEGVAIAKVTWIDKKAPIPTVIYTTMNPTNKDVVATVTFDKENVMVEGGASHTFTENGEFIFNFVDKAGNKGIAIAKVNWIDKTAPTAEIEYSTTDLTNKDVTVKLVNENEKITITNNDGNNTYTFTKNGVFTFEFVDEAGNKGTATARVNWIDKTLPVATITYNTTNKTNKDVVATISFDKLNVTVEGGTSHTFTENGEYTFDYVDEAGNIGMLTAVVDWIDKTAPTAEISYSTTDLTNKNVIVTLVNASEKITIINNDGKNTYTFTENGEFTFEFVDEAGNKGTATAKVNNIDKFAPTAEIEYSTTDLTNKDVVVTLIVDNEKITITNNDGKNTYTFTENGEFTFEFVDEAGNKGTATARVNNIDKVAPTAEIKYSTTNKTNKDVTVTLVNASEKITITNNGGKNTYTFTENGEFTFEFVDEAGNKGTVTAKVNNIDKTAPTAKIEFSSTEETTGPVIATIIPSEEVTITNNGGKNSYIFTENGKFIFEYVDKAGNKGETEVVVSWIISEENPDKAPELKVSYNINSLTNKDVIATLELQEGIKVIGSATHTFTENGEYIFNYEDQYGNKGTAIAKVDWIDKVAPTANVEYDVTGLTNKDVIASLVNPSEKITVINAKDGVYIFDENGEYIFEFVDEAGNKGSVVAKVDWIDKIAPTAKVEYSTEEETTGNVTVKITPSEKVTITNNNGSDTYTFTQNGEFTFEFIDEAGNKGSITAKVDWIVEEDEDVIVKFDNKNFTNKDVVVTIELKEGMKILNNNGSNTYTFSENGTFTFKYENQDGTVKEYTVTVDWIDKSEIEASISYDITNSTSENVTATLITNKDVIIKNNGGKNTYIFTENGEYTFEYVDKYGNTGSIVAKVDWINKNNQPEEEPTIPTIKPDKPTTKPNDNQEINDNNSNEENKTPDEVETPNEVETPDEVEKPEEGNDSVINDNEETNKSPETEKEEKNNSLIKKIIIAIPIVGILYFIILLAKKKKNDEDEVNDK